jgi:acetyl-CoA acetyltransferase
VSAAQGSGSAFVVGVGLTSFEKPGAKSGSYPDWVREAGSRALTDARLPYEAVQRVFVGYCYGDSTSGQRAVYELGLSGVPIINVNNNCSTGSSALYLARELVRAGAIECALAVGFEKMERGSLRLHWPDHISPLDRVEAVDADLAGTHHEDIAIAPRLFGNAGIEHMRRYGTTAHQFAWIAAKNHRHSIHNPYAQFRTAYSSEQILASRPIHGPLTKLQCSPTSDGAAAAVVVSEKFVDEHNLWDQAVEIAGQAMATDRPSTFEGASAISLVGADMTADAARQALGQARVEVADLDVIELHDCFSTNELISYEALGLADPGDGGKLVDAEATTYGGSVVVNPSGGLISKGHPLGATGLAQCAELTWQLRGTAGARQVIGARTALQHNVGLGGAAVVTVYRSTAP